MERSGKINGRRDLDRKRIGGWKSLVFLRGVRWPGSRGREDQIRPLIIVRPNVESSYGTDFALHRAGQDSPPQRRRAVSDRQDLGSPGTWSVMDGYPFSWGRCETAKVNRGLLY